MKTEPAQLILAQAILDSARVREESFDSARYQKEFDEQKIVINSEEYYGVSLQQACFTTNPELAVPVYLLLQYTWNDAIDWAYHILKVVGNC